MTREIFTPSPLYTIATAGPYPITHPYQVDTEIACTVFQGTTIVELVNSVDFTVAPSSSETTGDVTLSAAAFATYTGASLQIWRVSVADQGWAGQTAREKGLEAQLDAMTQRLQEVDEAVARAVKLPEDSAPKLPLDTSGLWMGWGADNVLMAGTPATTTLMTTAWSATLLDDVDATTGRATMLMFDSPAALKADVTLTTANTTIGAQVYAGGLICTIVASGGDISNINGVKFDVVSTHEAASWGITADASIDSLTAYVVSGTDDQPSLSAAIDKNVKENTGKVEIPHGSIYLGADITVGNDADFVNLAISHRGLILAGKGKTSSWPFASGAAAITGTALCFAPNFGLKLPKGRAGYVFRDMSIFGSVSGGALIDDTSLGANPFTSGHGGFSNVMIMNEHTSAPASGTVALRTTSMFNSVMDDMDIEGRPATITAYKDTAIAGADLYFGAGWEVTRDGKGGGGAPSRLSIRGFRTGFKVGLTAAEWAVDADKFVVERIEFTKDPQIHYCWDGLSYGRGVSTLIFKYVQFEACVNTFVRMSGGAGDLHIEAGTSSGDSRTGPIGAEFMRAAYILGNPTSSENEWGRATFKDHVFKFVVNAGILTYGGGLCGEIVLDGCRANNNGGVLVAIDDTTLGGTMPDILIKDFRGPNPSGAALSVNRLVAQVTVGAVLSSHVNLVDARDMARLEDCGTYGENILLRADLDLTSRRWPPAACYINTTAGDRTITLGDGPELCLPMQIEKRFSGGNLVISVPAGTDIHVVTGGTTTITSGAVTQIYAGVGFYTLTRLNVGAWKLEY